MNNKNVLPLNDILKVIHWTLLKWFLVITLMFIVLFSYSAFSDKDVILKFLSNAKNIETSVFCGKFNGNFFTFHLVLVSLVIYLFLLVAMILINGKPRENKKSENSQMITFMFLSISTLCFYIVMTGGFLDSPFSSSLSIYLAGFLLIQDRNDNRKYNVGIVIWTTFLVTLPYFYLSYCNTDDVTYFFDYSKNDLVVNFRLILSYGLAIFSIYSGYQISNKINKLYE